MSTEFPINRVYGIIAILYLTLIGINGYGIWDNNNRRAEAIHNAQIERAASKQEILDKITEVQNIAASQLRKSDAEQLLKDKLQKSDMEQWLKDLQKANPGVKVPLIK